MARVNLYKVLWDNDRHNAANKQQNTSFVVAAAGAKDKDLATLIQAANGDGLSVNVKSMFVEKADIITA